MRLPARRGLLAAFVLTATALLPLPAAAGTIYHVSFRSPVDQLLISYQVWLPVGTAPDSAAKRPAALFLHGRGGDELQFRTNEYLSEADARGFVLVFWGGRNDRNGIPSTYYIDAAGFPDESDILACLDDAAARFPVDNDRVHLAGFSQGGKGALLIGLKNAGRFASIVSGAGPSDAFQGQAWSPTFPDYRDAAGGPFEGASDGVLAKWFAQSPRFYLPNARNLPVALYHGTLDDVVPDDQALFRYRNTHHIADVPGFVDDRGVRPTLSELHAADPGGYSFEAHYISGAGHEQMKVLEAAAIFGFFQGKARVLHPERVVAVTFDSTERAYAWARLGRTTPPGGIPDTLDVRIDRSSNRATLILNGSPAVTLDGAAAGLDETRPFEIAVQGGSGVSLRIHGALAGARVLRDGVVLRPGLDYASEAGAIRFTGLDAGAETVLAFDPAPTEVGASDLLVPILVHSGGKNGSFFVTELTLFDAAQAPLEVEALLLDGSGARATFSLAGRHTALFASSDLVARFGRAFTVAPLRLRVTAGPQAALLATARVFNQVPGGGGYGLVFPIRTAADSVFAPGQPVFLVGGDPSHPSRFNVSFFAPFEDVEAQATITDRTGATSTFPVALARGARVQINDLFAGLPEPARLSIASTQGRLQVYGTVVSNSSTNDSYLSLAARTADAGTSWTVPAVAAANGLFGSHFSSDLLLAAPPQSGAHADITFRSRTGGAPWAATLDVPAGGSLVTTDVLSTLFPAAVPDAGALQIRASATLFTFAVTRSESPSGPASQDMVCVRAGDEITAASPSGFVGLAQSARARSNLVLVNQGPATWVELFLYAEDGPRGSVTIPLAEGDVKQIDGVARLFGTDPTDAAALLLVPAPGGRVDAAVSRLDNATNDPSGLLPSRWPAAAFP